MSTNRGEFSSSMGFVLAAAGAAIGLGNIWGFPSQTAQNGGAAFVLVYLVLCFAIAYPALMAELIIGRHAQSNAVGAFRSIKGGKRFVWVGYAGMICSGLVLAFYAIVSGWMVSHAIEPVFKSLDMPESAKWITTNGLMRDSLFTSIFFFLTILIILGGVKDGIEKWSTRLMPALIVMMLGLTAYVYTLDGAMDGLRVYLLPDFSKVLDHNLILSALGQSFFSLSVGVGAMLVYGSYIGKHEKLNRLGLMVTLADIGVAIMAGFLIIPALYVAAKSGTEIFDANGRLLEGPAVIFQALPQLFVKMGSMGIPVAIVFFVLMSVAALTSAISMLETSVSYAVDNRNMSRKKATWAIGGAIWLVSLLIVFNFDLLFNFVIDLTTKFTQPLLAIGFCVFIGWVMDRNSILEEIQNGHPEAEYSFFFKVWPIFVKVITPILILSVFFYQFMG
jgi:neurotransmitter:Na+ symporter, NSS family